MWGISVLAAGICLVRTLHYAGAALSLRRRDIGAAGEAEALLASPGKPFYIRPLSRRLTPRMVPSSIG